MSSSPAARRAERPRRGLAARLVVGLLGATLLVPLLAPADADAQEMLSRIRQCQAEFLQTQKLKSF